MARISKYTSDNVIQLEDVLIGTDIANKQTKNYKVGDLVDFFEENSTLVTSTIIFNQSVASSTWNITHAMNKFPSVTVIDSSNNVVVGEILYNSNASITLTFASPFSGKAYLN